MLSQQPQESAAKSGFDPGPGTHACTLEHCVLLLSCKGAFPNQTSPPVSDSAKNWSSQDWQFFHCRAQRGASLSPTITVNTYWANFLFSWVHTYSCVLHEEACNGLTKVLVWLISWHLIVIHIKKLHLVHNLFFSTQTCVRRDMSSKGAVQSSHL